LSRDTVLRCAQSKDPEGAYRVYAAQSFSTTEARSWRARHGLSSGTENKNLIRTSRESSDYPAPRGAA
jgi:hypothetical protein